MLVEQQGCLSRRGASLFQAFRKWRASEKYSERKDGKKTRGDWERGPSFPLSPRFSRSFSLALHYLSAWNRLNWSKKSETTRSILLEGKRKEIVSVKDQRHEGQEAGWISLPVSITCLSGFPSFKKKLSF